MDTNGERANGERRPRWGPMLAGFALFGVANFFIFLWLSSTTLWDLLTGPGPAKRSLMAAVVLLAVALAVAAGTFLFGERWFAAGWLGGYALLAIASSGSCAFVPLDIPVVDGGWDEAAFVYTVVTVGGGIGLVVASIWSARRRRRTPPSDDRTLP